MNKAARKHIGFIAALQCLEAVVSRGLFSVMLVRNSEFFTTVCAARSQNATTILR